MSYFTHKVGYSFYYANFNDILFLKIDEFVYTHANIHTPLNHDRLLFMLAHALNRISSYVE